MTRYDTFERRLLANVIDSALIACTLPLLQDYVPPRVSGPATALFWSGIIALVTIVYSVGLHARFGQTLGKRITSVRVIDLSETRGLTLRQALRRDIGLIVFTAAAFVYEVMTTTLGHQAGAARIADGLLTLASILWFLIEIVTMIGNSKRRALHDLIAGTVVVRTDEVTWTADAPVEEKAAAENENFPSGRRVAAISRPRAGAGTPLR
jgi:uncharacterized RDD family membrane protein YckC